MAKLKTSSNVGKPQTANKNKRRDRERSQKGDKELCTNDNSQAVTSPQTVWSKTSNNFKIKTLGSSSTNFDVNK